MLPGAPKAQVLNKAWGALRSTCSGGFVENLSLRSTWEHPEANPVFAEKYEWKEGLLWYDEKIIIPNDSEI